MRLTKILSRFVSSQKFYQVVAKKQNINEKKSPEELILSKYLQEAKTSFSPTIKTSSNTVDYSTILQQNPNGSIIEENYKNHTLALVSLDFRKVELKNILELCMNFKPDLILVQGSPQNYLPSFKLLPKKQGIFSDYLYLQQLKIPSSHLSNIIKPDIQNYFNTLQLGNPSQKVIISDTAGLIEDEVILGCCFWAKKNQKQVIMGEIPEQPWRQWICNSHTLMQIQQFFKNICKNVPFYETLQLSLQRLACLLNPPLLLKLRDRYMATLIEMIIAQGKYPRILGFMGTMQNQAVKQNLSKNLLINEEGKITPIIEMLIAPSSKGSVIRNITGWEIIQKHIILDIMKYGEDIMNIPIQTFRVTNRVIEHYGVRLNSYNQKQLERFRYDKTVQYIQIMKNQIEQGRELKKKFMLRQAVRNLQKNY